MVKTRSSQKDPVVSVKRESDDVVKKEPFDKESRNRVERVKELKVEKKENEDLNVVVKNENEAQAATPKPKRKKKLKRQPVERKFTDGVPLRLDFYGNFLDEADKEKYEWIDDEIVLKKK